MKQQQFEYLHQGSWQRFEQWLLGEVSNPAASVGSIATESQSNSQESNVTLSLDAKPKQQLHSYNQQNINTDTDYEFISLYRLICQHYSLAKQRHYSPQLVSYLHELVIEGHHQLYQKQSGILAKVFEFFAYTFPVRLREHVGLFWLSFACFTLPLLVMGLACYFNAEMLYTLMSDSQVREMEAMYSPSNDMAGRELDRRSDSDLLMFGHYIRNNVGIDFQIYGMGLFAGIGTLLSLLYNGLVIGGVAGHLSGIGYGERFWSFVVGHGSFELTAAVISGAAGLRLAQALFMPGNYSRGDAFKIAGKQSIELLIGAATMTFIAAFIEAFWSSASVIPNSVKYMVATVLWAVVIGYLAFAGRGRDENR